jgi:hypothetical protein
MESIESKAAVGQPSISSTAPTDWKALLTDILTNSEYQKMEAEGRAAEALGLDWDDASGTWVPR